MKRWTYYRSVQSLPLREAILLTYQIDLCGGMKDESTTDQIDLSWPRRWIYYRSVQSLLVNDQSHKLQLEALSRLILRLVNQETGGFGPLVSSHGSSRSWIPSTERIHKPRNTTAHKSNLKRWASLTLSRVSMKEPTTDRFRFTVLRMNLLQIDSILQSREINLLQISSTSWTRRQTYRRISLVLLVWLIMNYLFMTQSHHDVTSLDIALEINTFARADVAVLVILLAGVKMFLSRLTILNIVLLVQKSLRCSTPLCVSIFNHL
jgi:hypothetical protein